MHDFSSFHSGIVAAVEVETLNLAPADCEVRSLIKILNEKSIAPIEIHKKRGVMLSGSVVLLNDNGPHTARR